MPRATHARFAAARMQNARSGGTWHVSTLMARRRIRAPIVVALLAFATGLDRCISPTAAPAPPGGGQQLVLSFDQFQQDVKPVLVRQDCAATGDCRGGSIRGSFALSAPGATRSS